MRTALAAADQGRLRGVDERLRRARPVQRGPGPGSVAPPQGVRDLLEHGRELRGDRHQPGPGQSAWVGRQQHGDRDRHGTADERVLPPGQRAAGRRRQRHDEHRLHARLRGGQLAAHDGERQEDRGGERDGDLHRPGAEAKDEDVPERDARG